MLFIMSDFYTWIYNELKQKRAKFQIEEKLQLEK